MSGFGYTCSHCLTRAPSQDVQWKVSWEARRQFSGGALDGQPTCSMHLTITCGCSPKAPYLKIESSSVRCQLIECCRLRNRVSKDQGFRELLPCTGTFTHIALPKHDRCRVSKCYCAPTFKILTVSVCLFFTQIAERWSRGELSSFPSGRSCDCDDSSPQPCITAPLDV